MADETGHVVKTDSEISYEATCASCGATDKIHLWPHRNGHESMVGFIFLCSSCEQFAPNIEIQIKGIRGD